MTTKRNAMQTTINQLSLVMLVSEDIVKACKKADFHPDVVKVLLRMHEQQRQIEQTLNELRSNQLELAKTILMGATASESLFKQLQTMNARLGFDVSETVETEKANGNE